MNFFLILIIRIEPLYVTKWLPLKVSFKLMLLITFTCLHFFKSCCEILFFGRFGTDVMNTVAAWTKNLCASVPQNVNATNDVAVKDNSDDHAIKDLFGWTVLDIGTGNGLLLQEFAKQGYVAGSF